MSYPELQPVEASRTHGDGGERLCISITTPCKVEWPKMKGATLQVAQNNGNLTATTANSATPNAARASEKPPSPLRCPRCDSANTKFCYYNNYSLSQPRHFCKACKRYWTRGGTLRNVPVGGGCRKNKRSSAAKKPPSRGRPLLIPSPPGQPRLDGAAELYAMQVASAPFSSSPSLPISVLSGDLLPHLGGLGLGLGGSPAAGSEPTARVLDDYPNALLGSGSSFLPLDQGYEELAALQLSFGELQGLAMMKDVKLGGQIVNNNNSINSFSVCNNNWQMTPPDNSLEQSLGMYCLNANAGGWPEFYGRI